MSAVGIGEVVGAAIAMALFGAVFAWAFRRVASMPRVAAYALGIAVAVVFGAYVYTVGNAGVSYSQALLRYGAGGIIAFPLVLLTAGGWKR